MIKLKQNSLHTSGVFLLLTLCNSQVYADDTEIFLGVNDYDNLIKPNILFIMDTSGSMGESIDVNVGNPYSAGTAYSGSYTDDSYYYVFDGDNNVGRFPKSEFVCQDVIDEIAALGHGSGRFAEANGTEWNGVARWDDPTFDGTNNSTTGYVECEADQGVHGSDSASANVYANPAGWGGSPTENVFLWPTSNSDPFTVRSMNYANYLESSDYTIEQQTRFTVMRNVLNGIVPTLDNVNIGLMRFSGGSGGRIEMAVQDIDGTDVRIDFINTLDAFPPSYCSSLPEGGGDPDCPSGSVSQTDYRADYHPDPEGSTPLSETLYEAKRYFAGQTAHYDSSTDVDGLFDGNNFDSPIAEACQPNFVILLTDGRPTSDTGSDSNIQTDASVSGCSGGYSGSNSNGQCIDELAGYMAGNTVFNADGTIRHDWSDTDLSSLDSKQTVKVYPIGFAGEGLDDLTDGIAKYAGTKAYNPQDSAELQEAFEEIIADIAQIDSTLVAPAVTVNAFNQLQHSDDVFFALFRPEDSIRWNGNLKKYKVHPTGVLLDQKLDPADPAIIDGEIQEFSQSFWSAATDGHSVLAGGFASVLSADRNLYTYVGDTAPSSSNPIDLTATENQLVASNSAITKDLLNISAEDDTYRDNLIRWARGQDVDDEDGDGSTTDANNFLADPMHSRPIVVTYGGDEDTPDSVLFYADNMGLLHAVDVDDGTELFSFIPEELLPNIDLFYDNQPSLEKVYGLDGSIVAWVDDKDNNNTVDGEDKVMLYVGMRRGGSSYYAFDVTNRNQPKLVFQIKPEASGPLKELGQSWSTPKLAKIRWKCEGTAPDLCEEDDYKAVLVFGGGYDENQDETTTTSADSVGRAIFMVDAETGEMIFSAGFDGDGNVHDFESDELTNSFPADISFIDLDADGFEDTLFASDILGQIWRFDFKREPVTEDILHGGGMIADLSASSTAGGFTYKHRFYSAPDVAFFNPSGDPAYLTIGVGSGYRSSPLLTDIQDKYHLFKDYNVFNLPADYDYYKTLDSNFAVTGTRRLTAADLGDPDADNPDFTHGWARNLPNTGEKSLSRSITFNGNVVFTTFAPSPAGVATCGGDLGEARIYVLSHRNGAAVKNLDDDESNTLDISMDEPSEGIPPQPVVIFVKQITGTGVNDAEGNEITHETNQAVLLVGTNSILSDLEPVNKAYWRVNKNAN